MDALKTFLETSGDFFFYLALAGSVVMVIQFIMVLIGAGDLHYDGDLSSDFDANDIDMTGGGDLTLINFFSLRSLIAFLTFFGWAGYFLGDSIGGLAISLLCGVIMMILTTLTVYLFMKMQQSGNISSAEFVGKSGSVYLSIPAAMGGAGQVTVQMEDCTRQIKAMTKGEELKSGTMVKVASMMNDECFIVEKVN